MPTIAIILLTCGGLNTEIDPDARDYRSTRLVCAKLYEGGLLACSSVFNSIKKRPFIARVPEFELNMKLIGKHAEKALQYHTMYAYIGAGLAFCAYIFNFISSTISALFVIATIILICAKSMYLDKTIAINNFSKRIFNPGYNLDGVVAEHNIIETESNIKQNVITFGGYYPFLGAGRRARNWNFSIDSSKTSKKPDDGKPNLPTELSIEELYNAVQEEINKKGLLNISHDYILYADGNEVDKSKKLLPNRVGEPIDNLELSDLIQEGHSSLYNDWRTYFCLQYHDKLRSTLFSTFLRFSKVGTDIFAECSFYILPPIDENKYNVDRLALNDDSLIIKTGLITLVSVTVALLMMSSDGLSGLPPFILLILTIYPLFIVFKGRFREFSEKKDMKKRIERGEPHNYGAISTFREAIASSNYKNYFSAQDIIMVQNSIEQAIIYSVADLLDSKEIDSSFLRKEMIAHVNQNIMTFNGNIDGNNIAIGPNAKILGQLKDQLKERAQDISLIKQ